MKTEMYSDLYKDLYKRNPTYAEKVSLKHNDCKIIAELVKTTKSVTILDFGSGYGLQYDRYMLHNSFNISRNNIHCYDIAVEKFSKMPEGSFDGVISTDVLEHIPEEQLDGCLKTIFDKADKFVYIAVFCGLANNTLSNGENAHCTIKTPAQWKSLITKYNTKNLPLRFSYKIPLDKDKNILNL